MKISEMITDKYKLRISPTVYYDLLADVRDAEDEQEPKPEWEHDHEILKAYSDGASAVLDKVRAEIESLKPCQGCFYDGITRCLEIIDKYAEEDKA